MVKRNNKGQFVKGSEPIAGFQKGHKIRVGMIHSEESKNKISEFHMGHKGYWLGKKLSDEHKENLSNAHKGQIPPKTAFKKGDLRVTGKNNPNWKGGITTENKIIRGSPEYKEWRIKVFIRDNYICRGCGVRGGDLEAHHIKRFADYPELRFKVNNGVTLCKECHNKRPRISLWWYNNIYRSAKIGEGTRIGSYVEIGENVEIGKNCNIQSFCFIPEGVKIGDNVFLGPRVTFLNDKYPKTNLTTAFVPEGIIVKEGAVIGGGCVILPSIIIGENSFLGAGSLVTKDIPANEKWRGSPAMKYE